MPLPQQTNKALKNLRRLGTLLVWLTPQFLLSGCAVLLENPFSTDIVSHAMRSPEYVLRDFGGGKYLLAQWDVPVNGSAVRRVRYYDRNTGMLSRLPSDVQVLRRGYIPGKGVIGILGAVRYESDTPGTLVFFANARPSWTWRCRDAAEPRDIAANLRQCGTLDFILSGDGGRSFGRVKAKVPTWLGQGILTAERYEFAIVRHNTLYLGLYIEDQYLPEREVKEDDKGKLRSVGGFIHARPFPGPTEWGTSLSVVVVPLPGDGATPLPAAEIPREIDATVLSGVALVQYDLPQPMALLTKQPKPAPLAPFRIRTRSSRSEYIESIRADFPEWAAHQTLSGMPLFPQTMEAPERDALQEKEKRVDNDPVEWVHFDAADAK